jgi:hypothetical protein
MLADLVDLSLWGLLQSFSEMSPGVFVPASRYFCLFYQLFWNQWKL